MGILRTIRLMPCGGQLSSSLPSLDNQLPLPEPSWAQVFLHFPSFTGMRFKFLVISISQYSLYPTQAPNWLRLNLPDPHIGFNINELANHTIATTFIYVATAHKAHWPKIKTYHCKYRSTLSVGGLVSLILNNSVEISNDKLLNKNEALPLFCQ